MKTVAINSIKGGTGKSTLSILLVNALAGAGYKVLVMDTDASNNSLSFHFGEGVTYEMVQEKNIFNVFFGGPKSSIAENVIAVTDHIDLIHGDVRLNEFRSTDSIKRLKRALHGLDYDFCIIDTAPTYDIGRELAQRPGKSNWSRAMSCLCRCSKTCSVIRRYGISLKSWLI
jgi:chromosome partitioning protein